MDSLIHGQSHGWLLLEMRKVSQKMTASHQPLKTHLQIHSVLSLTLVPLLWQIKAIILQIMYIFFLQQFQRTHTFNNILFPMHIFMKVQYVLNQMVIHNTIGMANTKFYWYYYCTLQNHYILNTRYIYIISVLIIHGFQYPWHV